MWCSLNESHSVHDIEWLMVGEMLSWFFFTCQSTLPHPQMLLYQLMFLNITVDTASSCKIMSSSVFFLYSNIIEKKKAFSPKIMQRIFEICSSNGFHLRNRTFNPKSAKASDGGKQYFTEACSRHA